MRAFHAASGRHEFHGEVQADAPDWWPGRLLARLLGTPRTSMRGPIRFVL